MRETVTGNNKLAAVLGVSSRSITKWKNKGVLDKAILSHYGRTIIYDLEMVYVCLNHRKVTSGRPKNR